MLTSNYLELAKYDFDLAALRQLAEFRISLLPKLVQSQTNSLER